MYRQLREYLVATTVGALLLIAGCRHKSSNSSLVVIRADRQLAGKSKYPVAVDTSRVGTYPAETKSGAGYFYDDVLEYRVWFHPERGAEPLNGSNDYFVAFAQYEPAEALAAKSAGAESALVLVRQREWINEPEPGHYIVEKGERITEWDPAWLNEDKRTPGSIEAFLKHPRPMKQ